MMTAKQQKSYYINLLKSCQTGQDIMSMLDMISNEHQTFESQGKTILVVSE